MSPASSEFDPAIYKRILGTLARLEGSNPGRFYTANMIAPEILGFDARAIAEARRYLDLMVRDDVAVQARARGGGPGEGFRLKTSADPRRAKKKPKRAKPTVSSQRKSLRQSIRRDK